MGAVTIFVKWLIVRLSAPMPKRTNYFKNWSYLRYGNSRDNQSTEGTNLRRIGLSSVVFISFKKVTSHSISEIIICCFIGSRGI